MLQFKQQNFFCRTGLPQPELDGFDQHFQATVHIPLTSAVDSPQQHRYFSNENYLGPLGFEPGSAGLEASMLPQSNAAPSQQKNYRTCSNSVGLMRKMCVFALGIKGVNSYPELQQ